MYILYSYRVCEIKKDLGVEWVWLWGFIKSGCAIEKIKSHRERNLVFGSGVDQKLKSREILVLSLKMGGRVRQNCDLD